jgi:two-component system sensor histidine kinase TctE
VAVAAAPEGGGVAITVTDDGPGIDAEESDHVFERFYLSGRSPARQVGSGLGLAIVRELVEAMNGQVSLDRPEAGGTRIRIRLPEAPR